MNIEIVCDCNCKLLLPIEHRKVKTYVCPTCKTTYDISLFLHKYRQSDMCKCNPLVKGKHAEECDPCSHLCKTVKCKCGKKVD